MTKRLQLSTSFSITFFFLYICILVPISVISIAANISVMSLFRLFKLSVSTSLNFRFIALRKWSTSRTDNLCLTSGLALPQGCLGVPVVKTLSNCVASASDVRDWLLLLLPELHNVLLWYARTCYDREILSLFMCSRMFFRFIVSPIKTNTFRSPGDLHLIDFQKWIQEVGLTTPDFFFFVSD